MAVVVRNYNELFYIVENMSVFKSHTNNQSQPGSDNQQVKELKYDVLHIIT
jgi:hypothetical protein